MARKREIPSLERYYIWARRCQTLFERAVKKRGDDPRRWLTGDCGLFLTRWLAALCVVLEGCRRLRFEDRAIRRMLNSSNKKRLRGFRNTVCHYEANEMDRRLLEFLASPEAMRWSRDLMDALEKYFLAQALE